ncbi:MAG: ATPase, T2SS/T4P/T4SS family [Pseudomonadota bacterium]
MSDQREKINALIANLKKAIADQVALGNTAMIFPSGGAMQVKTQGKFVPSKNVLINPNVWTFFAKHIIGESAGKDLLAVTNDELNSYVGSNIQYILLVNISGKEEAKTFNVFFEEDTIQRINRIRMEIEEEVKFGDLGIEKDPASLASDEELMSWFDSFCTKVLNNGTFKVKDIVLSPSKANPFVSTTSGIFAPIECVTFNHQTKIIDKIGAMMIKMSQNADLIEIFNNNKGRFDTLDVDTSYKTKTGARFRVNIADAIGDGIEHGTLIVMKALPERPWAFEDLVLPALVQNVISNLKSGLILICGPSGCGKSTTLCSILDYLLRKKSVNLMTIESPIETIFPANEYKKSVVSQREIGKHSLTKRNALDSLSRQSLNVTMLGDIRSLDDAKAALDLAQSGSLVLANVQCSSLSESIDKILDLFPADQEKKIRETLSVQYKLGVCQNLIKEQMENQSLQLK